MTSWRHHLRRARLLLQATFACCAIVLALAVGLMQLALPLIVSHPARISAFLAERIGRPVSIDHIDGAWENNGPLLTLQGVHVGIVKPEQQAFVIPQAEIKVDFLSWLQRNRSWNEFRVVGLDLGLVHDAQGTWQLHGLGGPGSTDNGDAGNALFDLGSLVLNGLHLHVDDVATGRHLLLGADEVRLINSGSEHRVLAQVSRLETRSAPIDVVLEYDSENHAGQLYLGATKLDLAALLHGYSLRGLSPSRGNGRAQIWTWWQKGQLMQAQIEADLNDLVVNTTAPIALDSKQQVAPLAALPHLAFGARWQRSEDGWQFDVADLQMTHEDAPTAPAWLHLDKQRRIDAPAVYTLSANGIDLGALASMTMQSDVISPALRHWLYAANPHGVLETIMLRYGGEQDFDLNAHLAGLSWQPVEKLPGVGGISAAIVGDQDALMLALPQQTPINVDYPHVFRRPLDFSALAGTLVAYRSDAAWRIETDALAFEGEGYGGDLRGAIDIQDDGSRPLLDVYVALAHADVPASHLFWPINIMPPPAVAWLDRALAGGQLTNGRVVFRGDLDDWPFRNLDGRFEARGVFDNLRLQYLPDWPAAEHLGGIADFVNTSLHVETSSGDAAGNKVNNVTADIADLGEPLLELNVTGAGTGKDLLGFLRSTPIGQRFGAQLLGVEIGGQGKLDFQLHLPIKNTEQLKLNGSVALTDADLSDTQYNLHFSKANGKVRFSNAGFSADDLAVRIDDQMASFGLAVGAFCSDARHAVEATVSGNLPARSLLVYAPVLEPYVDHVSGNANWNIVFSADGDAASAGVQQLTVNSDLRGVALDLPAPLHKLATDAWPLQLTLDLPFAGGKLDLHLANLLHLHGRLPSGQHAFVANADFGADSKAALPVHGVAIVGNTPQLDLSGWRDFAIDNGDSTGSLIAGVDLKVQTLQAFGREFHDTVFQFAPGKDSLDFTFQGAAVDGSLHVPLTNLTKSGITAQFQRLYWPEVPEQTPSALIDTNPIAVPPLHVWINDFHLGRANYGEARMESFPTTDGMHIDKVETHSPNVEMNAHGDWNGRAGSDHSRFVIDLTAQNLGHMLDALGYAGVIDGGQTVAHIEAAWDGAPSVFALDRLDGTLKLSVAQGRIPDAPDPGAGRIFGLLNLSAIPRRLSLDFGDLFKSGFSFDSINALFTLKDGNAVTDNLEIKSPAADIRINGRTGLKQKDYDQSMEVTPHVSGTLAVGGAIVGGPIGVAAGVVLQTLFKNQINEVARAHYRVTGSWDKPVITLLTKETTKPKSGKDAGSNPSGSAMHSGLRQ